MAATADQTVTTIIGTNGKDDLEGTPGPDLIDALAGHDTIRLWRRPR